MEGFRLLTTAIYAHTKHRITGRARLQATIYLLQQLGLETRYIYSAQRYGLYSSDLHFEVLLCEHTKLLTRLEDTQYTLEAIHDPTAEEVIEPYRAYIQQLDASEAVVIELAANYHALQHLYGSHTAAIDHLRRSRRRKCESRSNEESALNLLIKLGLKEE